MNKRKLTDQELDAIGRELLRASVVPADAIEKAVASPMLFDSIKQRIELDRPKHEKRAWFSDLAALSPLNWNRAAAVVAASAYCGE